MGGMTNLVTHEFLGRNLSPPTNGLKDEPSHSRVPWSKFNSSYLWEEGLTKPLASALVWNLSPFTHGWKDEPSRECLSWNLSPSTFGWKYETCHLRVPWSKFKVLLPTGGRTNQANSQCLGTKFKSFYLREEGRTMLHTSVLVES